MKDVFVPAQAKPVIVSLTPELKKKINTVCGVFIDACRVQGLSPVESLAAVSFVQDALGKMTGGYFGTQQMGDKKA